MQIDVNNLPPPEEFAAILAQHISPEVFESISLPRNFASYQTDPIGFTKDILNETLTPDIEKLMLSVRDYPITIAISANGVGKTFIAARIAVHWNRVYTNSQVYTAAAPPLSNLTRLLWGEIGSILEKNPKLFSADTITSLHVQRSAQSFLTGVTIPSSGTEAQRESKFSGKHAPYLLFILDEGDAVPDEVYKGIESCMSGGYARMLIMFNPREEIGAVYRMIRDGRANIVNLSAFSHPNVITGNDVIPGAVTREVTVRRINEWCRLLKKGEQGEDTFVLPKFLKGAVAKSLGGKEYPPLKAGVYNIIEPSFSYMVLGRYPIQGDNTLISKEWVARARNRWDSYVAKNGEKAPSNVNPIMGQDVADMGKDDNVSCLRYGGWVPLLTSWSGVDPVVTGDRASQIHKDKNAIVTNVDSTGVGAGVAPQMIRNNCNAQRIMVASSPTKKSELGDFKILRDQLYWEIREWLRTDPDSMLPPDEELLEELKIITYRVENGKIRIMPKDIMKEHLKRSPCRSDALSLTFADSDVIFDPLDLNKCRV